MEIDALEVLVAESARESPKDPTKFLDSLDFRLITKSGKTSKSTTQNPISLGTKVDKKTIPLVKRLDLGTINIE